MTTAFLSEQIRQARKSRGLTQAQLAERLGMSEMTVRRWETNQRSPRMEEIQRIAETLSIPADKLISDADTPSREHSDTVNSLKNVSALKDDEATKKELVYEWGGGHRLELPNTPETREMFERLVMCSMTGQPAMA